MNLYTGRSVSEGDALQTFEMNSRIAPGRLKKNFDFSKTVRVDWSFWALRLFSNTGRKT